MRWFKHDSDASIDSKLQEILFDYGASGYGLYWYCVELIARNVTPKNITFELEHDIKVIARNLNLSVQEVSNMMQKMIDLGLFDISKNNKIACIKLVYRLDDSMRKGRQIQDILGNFIRENPDQSGKIPNFSGKVPLDIEKDIDIETEKEIEKPKRKTFKPPTQDELYEFSRAHKLCLDGMFDFYSANGWMVGKNKMKDWQAAARNWSRRQPEFKNGKEIKPDWANLPKVDEELWPWAKKHGYPNPGTLNFFQYRAKLNACVTRRIESK